MIQAERITSSIVPPVRQNTKEEQDIPPDVAEFLASLTAQANTTTQKNLELAPPPIDAIDYTKSELHQATKKLKNKEVKKRLENTRVAFRAIQVGFSSGMLGCGGCGSTSSSHSTRQKDEHKDCGDHCDVCGEHLKDGKCPKCQKFKHAVAL